MKRWGGRGGEGVKRAEDWKRGKVEEGGGKKCCKWEGMLRRVC